MIKVNLASQLHNFTMEPFETAVKTHPQADCGAGNLRTQALAAISASYLCISAGNVLGYTSTAIPSMRKSKLPEFATLSELQASLLGSLGAIGGLGGSLLAVFFIKYFGTRKTMLFFALPLFLLSWLSIGAFASLPMIYFGRVLGGLASGIIISTCPMYVTDVASSGRRGSLGVIPSLFLSVGILTSYIMGVFLDWQYLALFCGFVVFPSFVLLLTTPETPSWLVKTHHMEERDQVMERLGRLHEGEGGCEDDEAGQNHKETGDAQASMQEIDLENGTGPTELTVHSAETTTRDPSRDKLFASISYYLDRPFLIALGIMSLQQFVGINYVTFYGATVFERAIKGLDSNIPCIVFASTQVLGTLVTFSIIESYGRKMLLLISAALVGLMTGALGINFYLVSAELIENTPWIPVVALSLYIFSFCLGFGAVTWVLVVEILNPAKKHVQNPVLIAWMWFCSFLVTTLFPMIADYVNDSGVFMIFAGVAFVGVGFIIVFVPETKSGTQQTQL